MIASKTKLPPRDLTYRLDSFEVLLAVCCLLLAVCCLLSVVCCLLPAVCCLLPAVCCLLSALLSAVCAPSILDLPPWHLRSTIILWNLSTVCCLLAAVCCFLSAACPHATWASISTPLNYHHHITALLPFVLLFSSFFYPPSYNFPPLLPTILRAKLLFHFVTILITLLTR
jgi:hypothetical protein